VVGKTKRGAQKLQMTLRQRESEFWTITENQGEKTTVGKKQMNKGRWPQSVFCTKRQKGLSRGWEFGRKSFWN